MAWLSPSPKRNGGVNRGSWAILGEGTVVTAVAPLWPKDSPSVRSLIAPLVCFAISLERNARCAYARESRTASGTRLGCPKAGPAPTKSLANKSGVRLLAIFGTENKLQHAVASKVVFSALMAIHQKFGQ